MELVGRDLDDWQRYVIEGALGEREDGRWAAFEVGLIVPRQNGKNVCIEARELAGLFLFGDQVIIHSAHLFKTARKSFRDMERLIRNTPSLYKQVLGYKGQGPRDEIKGIRSNGAELSIELQNGNRLEYHARSAGGARGFTGDLIILDEAYDLDPEEIAAMMPTMAARSMDGNPQIWYTSSAGMPASEQLSDLRARGIAGNSARLAYFEWSAPEDSVSDDVDAWYEANPGLGIRISEEYVRETELESMGDEQFRRERLGIWAQLGGDRAISESEWSRILDPEVTFGEFAAFAIDMPPSRDSANVAAISALPDGRLAGQIVERRNGVTWLPGFLKELQQAWGSHAVPVVVNAGQSAASSLIPELEREHVRYLPISPTEYTRACAQVFDDIVNRRLAHRGQDELDAAVEGAKTKPVAESAWKWQKADELADISPLIALTLARHGWSMRGEKKVRLAEKRAQGTLRGRGVGGRSARGGRSVRR